MIDPETRKSFEHSGLETIRMLTTMGSFQGGEQVHAQALEWITEQTELLAANEKKNAAEQASMRRWTIIGTVAAIIAAVASIITLFQGQ